MAATGRFVLKICFALLITDVHSLRCYNKVENECSPSGLFCDVRASPSKNKTMTETECDADKTLCVKRTFEGTGNFIFKSQTAFCASKEDAGGLSNGCYDRDDLAKIDPDTVEELKVYEELFGITYDTYEACICDGNLCNGSIKSGFSISVIISSVVMSFMLFM